MTLQRTSTTDPAMPASTASSDVFSVPLAFLVAIIGFAALQERMQVGR